MHWYYGNVSIFVIAWTVLAGLGLPAALWVVWDAAHDRIWAAQEEAVTMVPIISLVNLAQEINRCLKLVAVLGIGIYFCRYTHTHPPYHHQDDALTSLNIVLSLGFIYISFGIFFGAGLSFFLRRRLKAMSVPFQLYLTHKKVEKGQHTQ